MQLMFSTTTLSTGDKFKLWQEFLVERFGEVKLKRTDDRIFSASIKAAKVGALPISLRMQSASKVTAPDRRRSHTPDAVLATFKLTGATTKTIQDDRVAVQRPGDLVLLTQRPTVWETLDDSHSLWIELPRARLESMLGPTTLYTSLTIGADLASTTLSLAFFRDLIRINGQFNPGTAERMASIGVDLIVASIAERMAREVPRSLQGNITLQRAKAYVEANLHNQALDPARLAAAMGLSLRRLQELFHEHGRPISDWIWERRLTAAAKRLTDPACLHMPIGTLAYECGFTSQAHFSRRFKDHYGMTPREYRMASALSGSKSS